MTTGVSRTASNASSPISKARACYLESTHAPILRFRALLDEEAPRVELALIQ